MWTFFPWGWRRWRGKRLGIVILVHKLQQANGFADLGERKEFRLFSANDLADKDHTEQRDVRMITIAWVIHAASFMRSSKGS